MDLRLARTPGTMEPIGRATRVKHFINQDMLAPNVLTIAVDAEIVGEFQDLVGSAESHRDYCTYKPGWNSDMRWISARSKEAFGKFQSAFDRLDVARHVREYLDIDADVRLYAGFLHTRSRCSKPDFHVDWMLTNNEAFTLLTPLQAAKDEQKLLYKKLTGDIAEYVYRPGEAIVFGDHFLHSTPPGSFDPPFSLLVFNFGTDKMAHWDKIVRTTGTQCGLIRRPDGRLVRTQSSLSK